MALVERRGRSSKDLVDQCIAPIKEEFWGRPTTLADPKADEAATKPKVSRRQQKRERKGQAANKLCHSFMKSGTCPFGDTCRFSHNVQKVVESKPTALPGKCPFSCQDSCPFGLTCLWASTHPPPDPQQLNGHAETAQHAANGQQAAADTSQADSSTQKNEPATADLGSGRLHGDTKLASAGEASLQRSTEAPGATRDSAAAKASEDALGQSADAQMTNPGQRDVNNEEMTSPQQQGDVIHVLPVSDHIIQPTNVLQKDVQRDLRQGRYNFSKAAGTLKQLHVYAARTGKPRKGMTNPEEAASQQQDPLEPTQTQNQGQAQQLSSADDATVQQEQGQDPQNHSHGNQTSQDLQPAAAESAAVQPQSAAAESSAALQPQSAAAATMNEPPAKRPRTDSTSNPEKENGHVSTASGCTAAAASEQDELQQRQTAKIWDVVAQQTGGDNLADLANHQREKPRLDLRGKLYLAPLTTVGNLPFRRICKGWGADVTCGEMAMCTNLLQGQASEWALLKRDSSEDLFGVQICGGYMDTMTRCAQLLEDQIDVDFVDVNCGCPIDLVCNKGAGSALLQKPERLEGVMRGVSTRLSCPVTLKLRTGYSQTQDIAHALLPRISSWGVAAATLHGRSRQQRYSGKANWDYIGSCAEAASPLQLIGNGDIFSFTDYEEHMAASPQLASVMIARGALMKPWLFTEIKERRHWDISAGERLEMLKRFCSFGLVHWGSDSRGVETTRRFLLEWLSYLYRYIPIALLDVVPQQLNWRAPAYVARNDLEVLMSSEHAADWIKISEMLLGPAPEGMRFTPKHKSSAYPPTATPRDAEQENG